MTMSHKKICTLSALVLKDKESRVCNWSLNVCRHHWANIGQRNFIPVNLFPLQQSALLLWPAEEQCVPQSVSFFFSGSLREGLKSGLGAVVTLHKGCCSEKHCDCLLSGARNSMLVPVLNWQEYKTSSVATRNLVSALQPHTAAGPSLLPSAHPLDFHHLLLS